MTVHTKIIIKWSQNYPRITGKDNKKAA